MSTLKSVIDGKFLAKLAEKKSVDVAKIEQLRKLLAEGKKLKPDDFVEVFSAPAGGDIQ